MRDRFIPSMAFGNKLSVLCLLVLACLYTTRAQSDPPLVVGTILAHPYLFAENVIRNNNNQTMIIYKGFVKDLMDEVTRYAGLTYDFKVREDSHFGFMWPNGTWGGLVGDLITKEIDIAAAPLTESAIRHRVVSFSTWFQTFGPVVIMKRTEPKVKYAPIGLSMRLHRLFNPLSESVWLLSIVAWLVTSIILYFISYCNPFDWRRMCRDREATMREGESFTCLNSFWFTLSTIFWQGYIRCPRSIGARIVVLSWWMYSLIFVSMYIASLTNFLQSGPMHQLEHDESDTVEINSIADLASQTKIDYGTLQKGATLSFFQTSQRKEYAKMWAYMSKSSSNVPTIEAGIQKVRASTEDKPFALIMESSMAKYYVNQHSCDIYMVKDITTSGSYSFAFSIANSTLEAIVDIALLTLRESGELRKMEDFWFAESKCPENPKTHKPNSKSNTAPRFYKVDLASFSGALILLVFGIACGSVVTGLEICIYKYAETGDKDQKPARKPLNDESSFVKDSGMHSLHPEPMTDV